MVPWFPAAPFSGSTGRLSNPNKSAFQPEGKMNKAGFLHRSNKTKQQNGQ
jgi:hypothetical protein